MASWEEVIRSTTVKELVRSKDLDLVYFKTGTTIRDALHTLSKNNILAAPVVDEQKNIVLGFVDVLDIAGFIVDQRSRLYGTRDRNFARKEFFDVVVDKVLDYSMVDVPVTVPESATVFELINLFNDQKMHRRLHRVAVSSHSKIYNVITQWDVVVFANKHKNLLPHRSASIQEHGIIRSTIMSRIDAPFYETLETLYKNRFMGLALIDDNGHIDGNFSASDLRGLTEKSFSLFTGSTLQFLVKGVENSKAGAPVTCTADASLESVVSTLVKEHIHRIYVTGNNDYPYGIVSLGDVISALRI